MADGEGAPNPLPPAAGPGVVHKAVKAGAFLINHRELLIEALDLLRKADTVSPEQEAKIVASYEEANAWSRQQLLRLVERLQQANFGDVLVRLHPEQTDLALQGRTVLGEGQAFVDRVKGDLQEFLNRNQPTVQAVARASESIADAARELANSLKYAGKEAADEIIRRSKTALIDPGTEDYEQAAFEWAARSIPRTERAVSRFVIGGGFLLILAALLFGASYYPQYKEVVAILTVVVLLALGFLLLERGFAMRSHLREQTDELNRLTMMRTRDRRAYLVAKWRARPVVTYTLPGEEPPAAPPATSFADRVSQDRGQRPPPNSEPPMPPSSSASVNP